MLPSNEMRARAILTERLESNDFAVSIQAITAASMVGSNEAMVARLEEFLKDRNVEVRLAAIHALADLQSPRIINGLRKRHYGLVTVPQLLALDPPPRHQRAPHLSGA